MAKAMSELHARAWLMEFTELWGKDTAAATKKLLALSREDLDVVFSVLFVSYLQFFKKES